jgi:transposase
MKAGLKTAVQAAGSHMMDIHGIRPAGAARILADVGDITRFPGRGHFASWTGTAPIDASSGQHLRHRLSAPGPQAQSRAVYGRDRPAAQRHRRPCLLPAQARRREDLHEAMRCLRRRLSDAACRQLAADARGQHNAGPGGRSGASLSSSAAGLPPGTGTSDQPLPGPRTQDATPATKRAEDRAAPAAATSRRRAGGVNVETSCVTLWCRGLE